MEEIKVGEYVRTIRGIGKILEIKTVKTKMDGNHDKSYKLDKFKSFCFSKTDFIKHSFELKEVLGKGDYVNGMEIDEFDDVEGNMYLGFPIYDDSLMNTISEFRPLETVKIQDIVTKEQFESIKYKVGD